MQKIKNILKQASQWVFLWYVLAVIIFMVSLNPQKAYLKRLHYITFWGKYPMETSLTAKASEWKFRCSVVYYRIMLKVFPNYARAHGMIGFCYHRIGYDKKSIQAYHQALILNPNLFWVYYNIAVLYYQQGEYEASMRYLKEITSFSREDMNRYAVLSSLRRVNKQDRDDLFKMIPVFTAQVQKNTVRLMIENHRELNDENYEIPASVRASIYPIYHPWNKVIDVGKEVFFQ